MKNTFVVDLDPYNIFYSDSFVIRWRRNQAIIYLILGILIGAGAMLCFPGSDSPISLRNMFLALAVGFGFVSMTLYGLSWHKWYQRSIITEEGYGQGSRFKISMDTWADVAYILERLYYGGSPPVDGVWGTNPRRLDEDYTIVRKDGSSLVFSRDNIEPMSRFKTLIKDYAEMHNIEWRSADIYYSRRQKAGARFYPYMKNIIVAMIPAVTLLTLMGIKGVAMYSASIERTIELRDTADGKLVWTLEFTSREGNTANTQTNQTDQTSDSGISEDDTSVSVKKPTELSVQKTKSGQTLVATTLPGAECLNILVSCIAFSSDARFVSLGQANGSSMQIRDLLSNKLIADFKSSSESPITFMEVSFDQTRMLSRDYEKQMVVWSVLSTSELYRIEVPNKFYHSSVFSPDGKQIYHGRLDGEVLVYDTETGVELKRHTGSKCPVQYMCVSPDGKKVFAAFEDNSFTVWDTEDVTKVSYLFTDNIINAAEFSADSRWLGTVEMTGALRVWNYEVERELFRMSPNELNHVKYNKLAFSNSAEFVALGSIDGQITIVSLNKGRITESFVIPDTKTPIPVEALVFSSDSTHLYVGCRLGILRFRMKEVR